MRGLRQGVRSCHLPGFYYLVSWKGYPEDESTWNPAAAIKTFGRLSKPTMRVTPPSQQQPLLLSTPHRQWLSRPLSLKASGNAADQLPALGARRRKSRSLGVSLLPPTMESRKGFPFVFPLYYQGLRVFHRSREVCFPYVLPLSYQGSSSCQSRYIATKYVWAIAHSPRPREGDSIRALLSTNVRPSRRPWAVNRLPIPNMERPACGVVQDLVTGL